MHISPNVVSHNDHHGTGNERKTGSSRDSIPLPNVLPPLTYFLQPAPFLQAYRTSSTEPPAGWMMTGICGDIHILVTTAGGSSWGEILRMNLADLRGPKTPSVDHSRLASGPPEHPVDYTYWFQCEMSPKVSCVVVLVFS